MDSYACYTYMMQILHDTIRYDTVNMHYNFTSRQSSQINISPHGPITHNLKKIIFECN